VKRKAHFNLVTGSGVNLHFVGEVEVTMATGSAWLWNEGHGGRLHCGLSYLGGGDSSLDFSVWPFDEGRDVAVVAVVVR